MIEYLLSIVVAIWILCETEYHNFIADLTGPQMQLKKVLAIGGEPLAASVTPDRRRAYGNDQNFIKDTRNGLLR